VQKVYLRPTGFVDAPRDGQALRLAGGCVAFAAVELIRTEDGRRTGQGLVPVAELPRAIAALPDGLRAMADDALARMLAVRAPLPAGGRTIALDAPQVMAILNVTPDSFSDGGAHGADPVAAGVRMAAAGAALIDVGGESTRPGALPVATAEELARIRPVVEGLAAAGVAIAVDTRKAAVMDAALAAGAGVVNDVSALLWDEGSAAVVARAGCPVVLMHHAGDPQTMQDRPHYDDVLIEVYDWLAARIDAALAAGIDRGRIIVDPGVGFGKTVAHNLALLNGLSLFHGLGCPILLGASRKRFIGSLSDDAPVTARLGGSVAVALAGATQGVQLLRVHDVAETVQALRIWRALRGAGIG
jgi:dihydropteroate synthase